MNKTYYNNQIEPLYVLHFPGTGLEGHMDIIKENLNRDISVSKDISIISIMNRQCYNLLFIVIQCYYNKIHLYNDALEEINWNNTLKISHILSVLDNINTKYALILDGRDTIIVNDLQEQFIETFKTFNSPVIFNGTPVAYPDVCIESLSELLQIKGKQKFLNAGVCFGTVEGLKNFYSKAQIINETMYMTNNNSEQLIIRHTQNRYPNMVCVDHENKLFRIVHLYDTNIYEDEKGRILLI